MNYVNTVQFYSLANMLLMSEKDRLSYYPHSGVFFSVLDFLTELIGKDKLLFTMLVTTTIIVKGVKQSLCEVKNPLFNSYEVNCPIDLMSDN